jgi:hypothetical protein
MAWRGGAATELELQSFEQEATKETKAAETNGSSFPLLPSVQIPWFEMHQETSVFKPGSAERMRTSHPRNPPHPRSTLVFPPGNLLAPSR